MFPLPRHNSSHQLLSELPADLLSAHLIWVQQDGVVPPLHPLYDGSYAVLRGGPRAFTLQVGLWEEIIAVSRLKACTAMKATPGSPRRCGRPPGPGTTATPAAAHPGSPAATIRVSFSDLLVSPPSQQEQLRMRPGMFFSYHTRRFLHAPGYQLLRSSTKAVSAMPAETALEGPPLTSSAFLPRPVLGGCPVEAAYTPGSWLVPVRCNSTMYSSTVVHCVQSLYIN
jgi:hypothetical protein